MQCLFADLAGERGFPLAAGGLEARIWPGLGGFEVWRGLIVLVGGSRVRVAYSEREYEAVRTVVRGAEMGTESRPLVDWSRAIAPSQIECYGWQQQGLRVNVWRNKRLIAGL